MQKALAQQAACVQGRLIERGGLGRSGCPISAADFLRYVPRQNEVNPITGFHLASGLLAVVRAVGRTDYTKPRIPKRRGGMASCNVMDD